MNSTFISPVITRASELGVSLYEYSVQELSQKLKNISSFATIGAAGLNKYQSTTSQIDNSQIVNPNNNYSSYNDLQRQTEEQEKIINNLENKLADAGRFASIGEARLNKWRSRVLF